MQNVSGHERWKYLLGLQITVAGWLLQRRRGSAHLKLWKLSGWKPSAGSTHLLLTLPMAALMGMALSPLIIYWDWEEDGQEQGKKEKEIVATDKRGTVWGWALMGQSAGPGLSLH